MEELLNTLKQLEKDYEEATFTLIELEKAKEVIEKKKREITIKLYEQRELIAEKKLIDYLNENGLVDEVYYQMDDDLDIDLEDEEAVENSDLVDYDYSDYCWDIEKVEDLSEVIGHIDLDDIEEWR